MDKRKLNAVAARALGARPRGTKSFDEVVLTSAVEMLVAGARISKNPLYYWEAYEFARRHELPVHPRVLRYFDGVARRLARPQGRGSKSTVIAAAVGLGTGPGQDNPFMRRDSFADRMPAVLRVIAGEKQDVVALDTGIDRRELGEYVKEFRRHRTVTRRKR